MTKLLSLAALAVTALATGLPAAAQFRSADDAIEYRQGALAVMSHHFGHLGAMANGKAPFDAAAQSDAGLVLTLSHLPWAGFVAGSDKDGSNARPEVWSQPEKFKAAQQRFEAAAAKLAEAAKAGKPDVLKAAWQPTADACKSCHDDFRKKH